MDKFVIEKQSFWNSVVSDAVCSDSRFVPARLTENNWGVADAQMQRIVESGLSFQVAQDHAETYSRHDKVQSLEQLRS